MQREEIYQSAKSGHIWVTDRFTGDLKNYFANSRTIYIFKFNLIRFPVLLSCNWHPTIFKAQFKRNCLQEAFQNSPGRNDLSPSDPCHGVCHLCRAHVSLHPGWTPQGPHGSGSRGLAPGLCTSWPFWSLQILAGFYVRLSLFCFLFNVNLFFFVVTITSIMGKYTMTKGSPPFCSTNFMGLLMG